MTAVVMPMRIPVVGGPLEVRIYLDIWIVGRVLSVSSDGGIDVEDDEGGLWSVSLEQRLDAWRFLDDPRDDVNESRALVNLCMISGASGERERILGIVRAYSVRGAGWIDSPEVVIQAIESGVSMGAVVPSSETGGHRAS